ncbi:OmpA family protein [Rhodovulum sp. YNF3179]|uniref:OmpA family protein n=1 Tax=Rhodovulum sp. YNF3179 TaxID=3425127 RepID=UPI003D34878E
MKRTHLFTIIAFALAAAVSLGVAVTAVNAIETRSAEAVERALSLKGHDWASVATDGLQVRIAGTAPTEAGRFEALSVAGETVNPDRIVDMTDVRPSEDLAPPRFSIEILRNGDRISLIGLVPGQESRAYVLSGAEALSEAAWVTDMLETADHPAPDGWRGAVEFALTALRTLPQSKISVSAGAVTVAAISDSPDEKRRLESTLRRAAPEELVLALEISAPRPVITPFTLRFILDGDGARFDSCSADTTEARDRILRAAHAAGLDGKADCPIGLGAPTPRWAGAVAAAIETVAALGGGSVTFADADISLVAPQGLNQERFDTVVHAFEKDLPEVFSLDAILPPAPAEEDGEGGEIAREFIATRSPEGLVQLRGRLGTARVKAAVQSVAHARFGAGNVDDATRIAENLPEGWANRVLAGIEGLGQLNHGSLRVTPDRVTLRGVTGKTETRARVTQLFSERLGDGGGFQIDIRYDESLDPLANLPTPEECVADIQSVLEEQQITFAPGSGNIDAEAQQVVDEIAGILQACEDVEMEIEIGGHTDSQGRESMNLALSQARAEAVLDGLLQRGVLTANLTAQGYGEAEPIADNDTEEGREANRRIAFKLIVPALEEVESDADTAQSDAAPEAPADPPAAPADPPRVIDADTATDVPEPAPRPAPEDREETETGDGQD